MHIGAGVPLISLPREVGQTSVFLPGLSVRVVGETVAVCGAVAVPLTGCRLAPSRKSSRGVPHSRRSVVLCGGRSCASLVDSLGLENETMGLLHRLALPGPFFSILFSTACGPPYHASAFGRRLSLSLRYDSFLR